MGSIPVRATKNKMEHFLIDGYNLIYSNESLKNLLKNYPVEARERLVQMVSDFIGRKKINATIIFDGAEEVLKKHKPREHIRVIYSYMHSADTEIKNLIDASKNKKKLMIVSSDNEIQNYAKVCGAKFMRSQEFIAILKSKRTETEFHKKSDLTKGEVDYWLKIFNNEN